MREIGGDEMGTWILILTLYNGGVTSISGFSSGNTCSNAGKVYLNANRGMRYVTAVCIQVK